MSIHIISYDLKGHESRDEYRKLYREIYSLGKVEWIQFSTWIVETPLTDVEIRNHLQKVTDFNDSLFVATLSSYASFNIPVKASNLISRTWNPPLSPLLGNIRPKLA